MVSNIPYNDDNNVAVYSHDNGIYELQQKWIGIIMNKYNWNY